jgi:hypothetical protein
MEYKYNEKHQKTIILCCIEMGQLIWFGHVKRMNMDRWPKRILNWIPSGRQKRGRPRRRWTKGTEEAMTAKICEKAGDRIEKPGDWERRNGDSHRKTSLYIYIYTLSSVEDSGKRSLIPGF